MPRYQGARDQELGTKDEGVGTRGQGPRTRDRGHQEDTLSVRIPRVVASAAIATQRLSTAWPSQISNWF